MVANVNAPNASKQLNARQLEVKSLELRITGATFAQIGEALGVTGEAARKAVNRALERTELEIADSANLLRELERQRMENMILAAMPGATRGDVPSIEAVRKLSESIRKLLNLDLAGLKITIGGAVEVVGLQTILETVYASRSA